MLNFKKYDKYNQEVKPGDVCVRLVKTKHERAIEICVYKGDTRGNNATGKYGRFITPTGTRSIKYSSVIFVFDPMGTRKSDAEEVRILTKQFYENKES